MAGELRRDVLSGRTVVVAPARSRRPGAPQGRIEEPCAEELESCPFCEGREERTPPESLALPPAPAREPDTPGWSVRVVPNLYPAFEHQEVVIHSGRHVRSFADLDPREVDLVADAWRARALAARGRGFDYVHALVNEGRAAGASLAHSHSQLVWLREEPPAVAGERGAECALCELLEAVAGGAGRALALSEEGRVRSFCPPAGRVPYEVVIAPPHEPGAFTSELLPVALRLLGDAVRRLRTVEGPVPWNAWLHGGPHWHVELVPRLTVLAGIELGAGIYVNTLDPEDAARALRGAQ